MADETKQLINIDLNQFKLHLVFNSESELTLHFDSPSRRFYLSVIGLAVHEMKKRGMIAPIALQTHLDVLILLNKTVGASAGSSRKEHLLPRIYRKWKDALPDLENAPLFKILGKTKKFDELMEKVYIFTDAEKDSWANLFEYRGSHENVRLRFSVDRIGATLDDVSIVYGENPKLENGDAWEAFIKRLKEKQPCHSKANKPFHESKMAQLSTLLTKRKFSSIPVNWRWPLLLAVIGLIIGTAAVSIWKVNLYDSQVEVASIVNMAFPLPAKPSIAVLPFRNLSNDPKQDYFCDGMTEEIITAISQISSLFVIAHSSSFAYKGKEINIQQVRKELGVRYVIEGGFRIVEDRIRITAQLTDAVKGRHLWGERYDRNLQDIFVIQDEITLNILSAISYQLTKIERIRLLRKTTENLHAYLKALEGIGYMNSQNFNAGLRCFEEALILDRQFAEAYAWEAQALLRMFLFGPSSKRWGSLIKSMEAAKKCKELDDELGTCDMILGAIYLVNRDYIAAVAAGKRAVERRPNCAEAATYLAITFQAIGRYDEALSELGRALRLDPIRPVFAMSVLGFTYYEMGRIEEAIAECKEVVKFYPQTTVAYMVLALAYCSDGRREEARDALDNILRIRPDFLVRDYQILFPDKTEKDIHQILDACIHSDRSRR